MGKRSAHRQTWTRLRHGVMSAVVWWSLRRQRRVFGNGGVQEGATVQEAMAAASKAYTTDDGKTAVKQVPTYNP